MIDIVIIWHSIEGELEKGGFMESVGEFSEESFNRSNARYEADLKQAIDRSFETSDKIAKGFLFFGFALL
ncbi:MAG: hypothetical protein AAB587_02335 [Patescibacteria group bacterium]